MPRKSKNPKSRKGRRKSSMVKTIKSVINKIMPKPELKQFHVVDTSGFTLGQVNGTTGGGFICEDITPQPAQGLAYGEHIGNEIQLYDMDLRLQTVDMTNRAQPVKVRIEIFHIVGEAITPANFVPSAYYLNDFVGGGAFCEDYNSIMDRDYKKAYKRLLVKTFTHAPDNFSGQSMVTSKRYSLRLRKHKILFAENTTTVQTGQLLMVVMCDGGNKSTGVAATATNVPTTQVSSGLNFNYVISWRYTDS